MGVKARRVQSTLLFNFHYLQQFVVNVYMFMLWLVILYSCAALNVVSSLFLTANP